MIDQIFCYCGHPITLHCDGVGQLHIGCTNCNDFAELPIRISSLIVKDMTDKGKLITQIEEQGRC